MPNNREKVTFTIEGDVKKTDEIAHRIKAVLIGTLKNTEEPQYDWNQKFDDDKLEIEILVDSGLIAAILQFIQALADKDSEKISYRHEVTPSSNAPLIDQDSFSTEFKGLKLGDLTLEYWLINNGYLSEKIITNEYLSRELTDNNLHKAASRLDLTDRALSRAKNAIKRSKIHKSNNYLLEMSLKEILNLSFSEIKSSIKQFGKLSLLIILQAILECIYEEKSPTRASQTQASQETEVTLVEDKKDNQDLFWFRSALQQAIKRLELQGLKIRGVYPKEWDDQKILGDVNKRRMNTVSNTINAHVQFQVAKAKQEEFALTLALVIDDKVVRITFYPYRVTKSEEPVKTLLEQIKTTVYSNQH